VQIILTSTISLLLAALGFLSPAARGALVTTTMILYVWLAIFAGFSSVYLWGVMERSYTGWPGVCLTVSVYFPGIVFSIFSLMNLVIFHTGTTGAVPLSMYFTIVFVWFAVSIPLTFVGGYLALRVPILEHPVKTNQIPRHVPPPPMASSPVTLLLVSGLLPFGTLFIELYFAMTSIWLGYFYYLFGFVFLIGLLSVIINAEIAILCTYAQLCAEDANWWWASFRRGGSVAIYITIYSFSFLLSRLSAMAGFMPVFIYVSYMAVIILAVYFAMGTIGFLASYVFTYCIFKAVKSD
jgi:transmembrane 9 superfamily protein 2/4